MNVKHTPGPWMFDHAPRVGAADGCEIRTVAEVQHTPKFRGPCFIGTANTLVNARLMAAAPDLLAALKTLADEQCATEYHGEEAHDDRCPTCAAIARARAVIAAAEGAS